MIELLVLEEELRAFCGKYDMYMVPAMKFFPAFAIFYLSDQNIGFVGKLKNPMTPLLLGVVSAFLPYGTIMSLAAMFMLPYPYNAPSEIALVMLIVLVIVGILYYGFQSGDNYLLLIMPVLFFLKIPYAIPLLVELSGSLVPVIPVSCDVFLLYAIQYVKQNVGILINDASVDIIQKYAQVTEALFNNQLMMVVIAVLVAGILVVYVIRTLSTDCTWWAAIIAGMIAQVAAVLAGDLMFNVSAPMGELLFGAVVSVGVMAIRTSFAFAVGYSGTEHLQYEDGDYHYYVKVMSKIVVSTSDVKVQKINVRWEQRNMRD